MRIPRTCSALFGVMLLAAACHAPSPCASFDNCVELDLVGAIGLINEIDVKVQSNGRQPVFGKAATPNQFSLPALLPALLPQGSDGVLIIEVVAAHAGLATGYGITSAEVPPFGQRIRVALGPLSVSGGELAVPTDLSTFNIGVDFASTTDLAIAPDPAAHANDGGGDAAQASDLLASPFDLVVDSAHPDLLMYSGTCNPFTQEPCAANEACERDENGAWTCFTPNNNPTSCFPTCPPGQTCVYDNCVDICASDADCPSESTVLGPFSSVPVRSLCIPLADSPGVGACSPRCSAVPPILGECGANAACRIGQRGDGKQYTYCDPHDTGLAVYSACVHDVDCSPGERCNHGSCIRLCVRASDCVPAFQETCVKAGGNAIAGLCCAPGLTCP